MLPADPLEVPRQHGLFLHHGINLGDGTIVHYLEGKEILRSSYEDFRQGEEVSIVKHINECSSEKTIKRALSKIGEKKYNLLFNNCEHFATCCKTGHHHSNQVDNLFKKGFTNR